MDMFGNHVTAGDTEPFACHQPNNVIRDFGTASMTSAGAMAAAHDVTTYYQREVLADAMTPGLAAGMASSDVMTMTFPWMKEKKFALKGRGDDMESYRESAGLGKLLMTASIMKITVTCNKAAKHVTYCL